MTDPVAPTGPLTSTQTSELTLALGDALRSMERIRRRASLAWGPDIVTVAEIHGVERSLRDALARSTPAEPLDVERLAAALQQSSYGTAYHDTTGRRPTFADLTWEQRARKLRDASNIAAEYVRLRSSESAR